MIPEGGTVLPDNDVSITSCGRTVVVETRPGLEVLDRESIITGSAEKGTCMSLGIGRFIIGKTGGGDRPCGCSTRVGERWGSSNRREVDDGEGAAPP